MSLTGFQKILDESTIEAELYVTTATEENIFKIELNRPKQQNAFTIGMYLYLNFLLEQAHKDNNIHVILLSSTGKNFCSGNELSNFSKADFSQKQVVEEYSSLMGEALKILNATILNYSKPLICCCQGAVIGFIFPLLALFDQTYVTKDAYFQTPMIKMGQGLEMFGSYTFPRLFGSQKSFELLVLGRRLNSQDAYTYRFASQIFENQSEMMKGAIATCKELQKMNQQCVRDAKILMRKSLLEQLWAANVSEINNLQKIWVLIYKTYYLLKDKSSISNKLKQLYEKLTIKIQAMIIIIRFQNYQNQYKCISQIIQLKQLFERISH